MTAIDGHRAIVRWLMLLLRVGGLILVVALINVASAWFVESLDLELTPRTEPFVHRMIMVSVVVYALLIAVPFVPGVEIGVALLAMVGSGIALPLFAATVAGLFLSFLIGRFMPLSWLKAILGFFYLARVSRLIDRMAPLDREERLAFLVSRAPHRLIPTLLRHRYLALAVALNIPGNVVIGGGGGISMAAGISRLYATPWFLLTLALAVAPVPLAVLVIGGGILAR